MIYEILAHFTIFLHFVWILFLIFGVFFALKWPKVAIVHLGGLFFSLILNLFRWYCPLTYLENYLRRFYDVKSAYGEPFIATYLERLVYPDLPELYIRVCEIIFVILYVAFYAYLARKHHILGWIRKR
ncbi:MAG: DUF2784 domain-containing protein [Desulfobacteraceae bacterium]|jgi:hypothetical protein